MLVSFLFFTVVDARPDGSPTITGQRFETIIYVDYGQSFHGAPLPHIATHAATEFHLTQGGTRWFGPPKTVKYSIATAGCVDDCAGAAASVNAGFDAWEPSGITYTQDNVSPYENPCTGSPNSVSWAAIDGAGGTDPRRGLRLS